MGPRPLQWSSGLTEQEAPGQKNLGPDVPRHIALTNKEESKWALGSCLSAQPCTSATKGLAGHNSKIHKLCDFSSTGGTGAFRQGP